MRYRTGLGAVVAAAVVLSVCGERDEKHLEQEKVQEEPGLSYEALITTTTTNTASIITSQNFEFPTMKYPLTDFRS